jgi:hypothetical protein
MAKPALQKTGGHQLQDFPMRIGPGIRPVRFALRHRKK